MPLDPVDPSTSWRPQDLITLSQEHQRGFRKKWQEGILWALLSPIFLGTVPVLAKIAFAAGVDVLTVVFLRTIIAAALIWLGVLFLARHLVSSSLPAIVSSLLAGGINGLGSLFFYASLTRIDASLGQLINITYLIFVALLLRLIGLAVSWITFLRAGLATFAIYLLVQGSIGSPDWLGVGMMFFAALTFAIQLVLSQRILFDIPALTMTLYSITAMATVVTAAWLVVPHHVSQISDTGWLAIILMGIVTALSRLSLFLGVKYIGSIQTALLGVLEVIVTIGIAAALLGERLTPVQWLGAILLVASILMARFEQDLPRLIDWWRLMWRWRLPD
jgi:drug/metabolite transporter (DMT)-like permease